jgi:hypothetical protein
VVDRPGARQGGARGARRSRPDNPATCGASATRRHRCGLRPAAHVTRLDLRQQPPDPQRHRAARGQRPTTRATDSYTLYVSSQNPHVERLLMCAFVLGIPEHKLRVVAPDVGGGFGSARSSCTPRDGAGHLGRKQLGRPSSGPPSAARPSCPTPTAATMSPRSNWPGQGRQVPRPARQDHRQPGRLSVDLRLCGADHPVRHAAGRPVRHAEDLLRGEGGVHQHRAGRRLPRRRPARGHLRGRAHRRDRPRARWARPGRDPPAQLHPRPSPTRRRWR